MPVIGDASIIVRAITTGVKKDIEKAFAGLDKAMEKAGQQAGESFMDGLSKEIESRGEEIGKKLNKSIMSGLGDKDKEIADLIGRAGDDAGEKFSEGFTEAAFDGLDGLIDDLVDSFDDAGNDAGDAFGDSFSDSASDFIDDTADYAIDIFGDAGSDAGDAFGDSFYDSVSSRLGDLTGTISGDFSQLGRDAGTAFGDNFAISSRDGLTQAGSDFGRAISDAINANIDIQQPSAFRDIATTALGTRASGAADTTPADLLGGAGGAGIGQALADLLLLADTAADVADAFHEVNDAAGSPPDSAPWDEFLGSMQNLERSNKALADSMNDVLGSMTSVGDDADDTSGKLDNVADAMRRVSDDSDFQMSLPFDGVAADIDDVTDALDRHGDSLRSTRDAAVEYQMQIPFDYSGLELDRINRELRQHVDNFEDISDSDPFPGMAVNARSTGSALDQLSNQLEMLVDRDLFRANEQFDALEEKMNIDLNRSFNQVDTNLVNTHDYLVDLNLANDNVNESFSDTSDVVEDSVDALDEFSSSAEDARDATNELNVELERTRDVVVDLSGAGGGRRGSGINDLFSPQFIARAKGASEAFTNLFAAGATLGPAIAGLVASISALASGLFALVAAATPAVGVLGAIPGLIAPIVQGALVGVSAFSGLGDAVKEAYDVMDAETPEDAAEALEKLNKTLETMDASAGPLVVTIAEMRDEFRSIRNAGQAGLFPEVNASLKTLTETLTGPLIKIFRDTGDALGVVVEGITKLVTSAGFLTKLDLVSSFNIPLIKSFGKIFEDLVDIFASLLIATAPLVERFTRWVGALTAGWRATLNTSEGMRNLINFFERAGDVAAQLGRIFGNLFGAIFDLGGAAQETGGRLLDSFEEATAKLEEMIGKARDDNTLKRFFENVGVNVRALGGLVNALGFEFLKLGDNTKIAEAADGLIPFAETLGRILDTLTNSGPALSELVTQLADLAEAFTDVDGNNAFLDTLTLIAEAINAILDLPFVAEMVAFAAPLIGIAKAGAIAWKAIEFFTLVIAGSIFKVESFASKLGLITPAASKAATAAGGAAAAIGAVGVAAEGSTVPLTINGAAATGATTTYGGLAATSTAASGGLAKAGGAAGAAAGPIGLAGGAANLASGAFARLGGAISAVGGALARFAPTAALLALGTLALEVFNFHQEWDSLVKTIETPPEYASLKERGKIARDAAKELDDAFPKVEEWGASVEGLQSILRAVPASLDNLWRTVTGQEDLGDQHARAMKAAADAEMGWTQTLRDVSDQLGITELDVETMAQSVDLTGLSYLETKEALIAYHDEQIAVGGSTKTLNDAQEILNSTTATADEKARAYADSLDALSAVQQGIADANASFEESYDTLTETFDELAKAAGTTNKGLGATLLDATGALDLSDKAGRRVYETLKRMTQSARDQAQAAFDQEVATGNVAGATEIANGVYQESIGKLDGLITDYGLTRDNVIGLVGDYGKVPPFVPQVDLSQFNGIPGKLGEVKGWIAEINGKKVVISVGVDLTLTQQAMEVLRQVKNAERGGTGIFASAEGGPVKGPGGPKDDLIPMMLSNGEFVLSAKAVENLGGMLAVTKLHNTAKMTDLTRGTNPSAFSGDIAALTNANRASIGAASGGGYNVNIGQIVAPTPEIAARRVISETRAAAYRMGVGV